MASNRHAHSGTDADEIKYQKILFIHTGCENWEPLPPFPTGKLLYCATFTGTEGREAKVLNPASGWILPTGTTGELFCTYNKFATEADDIGFTKDGEKVLAAGLSLNS